MNSVLHDVGKSERNKEMPGNLGKVYIKNLSSTAKNVYRFPNKNAAKRDDRLKDRNDSKKENKALYFIRLLCSFI